MTQNMELVFNLIKTSIETKYDSQLPTLDQIREEAENFRAMSGSIYPITDDEFDSIVKRLPEKILHSIGEATTLRRRDSEHQSGWYRTAESDGFFWGRYKSYLKKKWNETVVEKLHNTTDDIMDDLGNPKSDKAFQRRGLLLGDVQSGKTATYTAICNKSADIGYRVIIVLTGLTENLRIQTQERLDTEFVGLDSKHTLDKKADSAARNVPVGVGKEPPFGTDKRITRFTSVTHDFKTSVVQSNGLNLKDLKGTALFVVKKHKSILNNLKNWLTKDEDMIDLPMLLIDDEADNASVNTNSEEKEPTAINAAINALLRSFRQATYLGITATPFANIFIDPDIAEDGAAKDLFPKDFLTLLPSPSNYIGADKIFGNGNVDNWKERTDGEYAKAIIPILNDEQNDFYYFRHKKTLAEELPGIPPSLKEAIRYFILTNAICDHRYDNKEHRSMMVNVSRFTDVHTVTVDYIKNEVEQIRSDLENYAQLPDNEAIKIRNIALLKATWERYGLENISGIKWGKLLKEYLFKSARRIDVREVNRNTGAKSLDYYNYNDTGMRVIAVGGDSMSRGLTLEGLSVTYFYRNTMMYDTLLQMGRWFGYRPNYDDLFKIWMGEDAIDWFSYITDAFNELKEELRTMKRQNFTPEEFGLKVRQDPGFLIVTARNKMRKGTSISVPITLSGRLVETPRLWCNDQVLLENNRICEASIKRIEGIEGVTREYDKDSKAIIWRCVPKKEIADLVKLYKSHPWNLNFQATALADFIMGEDVDLEWWDLAIPCGTSNEVYNINLGDESITISPEPRKISKDGAFDKMLRVNERHVRVGQGGCTRIGLSKEEIDNRRKKAKEEGKKITDKTYLELPKRRPIALVHIMENSDKDINCMPQFIFALGLGFPAGKEERTATYVVNTTELKNYIDYDEMYGEDDNDV